MPQKLYRLDLTLYIVKERDVINEEGTEEAPLLNAEASQTNEDVAGSTPAPGQSTPTTQSSPTRRRTATQAQLLVASGMAEAEGAAGNFMVALTTK